ncbi:hypothetical protein [Dyella acidiphila]|uniref:Quinol:cytochrome c oxidoreductase quinone-binding subunit 2 n=1 Tax=Dyella acidiphila TaxID=2775866 RepID=A0ABR9GBW5_9GAMM|nr:hypothetical protein [Dyella acidiphila]MBE1161537.1 hypothetical protein [Dyella acidiphila]
MAGRVFAWLIPVALIVIGFLLSHRHLQHALLTYLACWLFVLAVTLGSVSLLLIHALTGGGWGDCLRAEWLAAARLFPWVAVAAIPLLLGMHTLFPWLQADVARIDPDIARQCWYLNATGLWCRTLIDFLLWYGIVRMLLRRDAQISAGFAAGSLLLMVITVSVLAVDWVMSLVPRWHSTDIGLLVFSSQLLVAFALSTGIWLGRQPASGTRLHRDFGSLLLAMVLGWAYVSFMDYLTAWVADQPSETAWYLPRVTTDWQGVAIALVILGLVIPFFTLLSGRAKSSARVLIVIAAVTFLAQGINTAWLILPGVMAKGTAPAWSDLFLCAGLLGLCAMRYRVLLITERQTA